MHTTQWIAVAVAFCALAALAVSLTAVYDLKRRTVLLLQLFGFTTLSAAIVWYALSRPREMISQSLEIVADLVAVNPYNVENQSGGTDAPWLPGGQWLIGGRNGQPVIALDLTSPDSGTTLAGTVRYKGEDAIALRAKAIGTNTYLVENHQGAASAPWRKGGIWVLGARDVRQPVIALKAASQDDGLSLAGTMTYRGENPIGFRTRPPEIVQAPPPVTVEVPVVVGDLVAVNPYTVENQSGGSDAPWRPGGQWLIGGRNEQPVIALDVSSPDDGATIAGTVRYKGESAIAFRAQAIGANTYLVENRQGASSDAWRKGGIWVLGSRGAQQPVVALRAVSPDDGLSLSGTMTYKGERPIGFRTRPPEIVQAPPPVTVEVPVVVGDLVAVNPYSVENQSGETDAPWRPDGQWLIGGRNEQPVIALDVTSPDDGATLAGSMRYQGENAIAFRAKAIGANTYLVENRVAPSQPWRKGGIWALGARGAEQPVIALKVASQDDGLSLIGTMTYKGEPPTGFRTRPPETVQAPVPVTAEVAMVVAEVGKLYREDDKPDVLFQYSGQGYCQLQNPDQMRTYGGAVIAAPKLRMAGQFAGDCPWRDGFYRINVDGVDREYLLAGVGDVQDVGRNVCRLLTPGQRDQYSNTGAFSDFGTINPTSNLTRMRGDRPLGEVEDCPWVGLERVSFAFNDDTLKPGAKLLLDDIARSYTTKLGEYRNEDPDKKYVLVVEGHTDYSGENAYNCRLALRRARKVAASLEKSSAWGKDVRIVPIGFGFHRLLTKNPKGEKVSANRRFEVRLIEADSLPSEQRAAEACGSRAAD